MTVVQADKARSLIAKKGRLVSFIKLDITPADSSKPWRGAADARATPASTVANVAAVFVPPSSAQALGFRMQTSQLDERVEQIAIVSTGGTVQTDLSDYDEVIDSDNSRWKIEFVEKLAPAEVNILYFVGMRR